MTTNTQATLKGLVEAVEDLVIKKTASQEAVIMAFNNFKSEVNRMHDKMIIELESFQTAVISELSIDIGSTHALLGDENE